MATNTPTITAGIAGDPTRSSPKHADKYTHIQFCQHTHLMHLRLGSHGLCGYGWGSAIKSIEEVGASVSCYDSWERDDEVAGRPGAGYFE